MGNLLLSLLFSSFCGGFFFDGMEQNGIEYETGVGCVLFTGWDITKMGFLFQQGFFFRWMDAKARHGWLSDLPALLSITYLLDSLGVSVGLVAIEG